MKTKKRKPGKTITYDKMIKLEEKYGCLVGPKLHVHVPQAKPDPVQLGVELAEYLSLQWAKLPQAAKDVVDITLADHQNAVYSSLMLRWERDFWREKALGK